MNKPNILLIMCDQLRADTIAALGNSILKTPHMDRLVRRDMLDCNQFNLNSS